MYIRDVKIEDKVNVNSIDICLVNYKGRYQVFYCKSGTDITEHLGMLWDITNDKYRKTSRTCRPALTKLQAIKRFEVMTELAKSMKFNISK